MDIEVTVAARTPRVTPADGHQPSMPLRLLTEAGF
jgi:hypothetical protein